MIVRLLTWGHRTQVYKAGKRSKFMKFKVDLTKRRVNLLSRARSLIESVDGNSFSFSDVNCRLNEKGDVRCPPSTAHYLFNFFV